MLIDRHSHPFGPCLFGLSLCALVSGGTVGATQDEHGQNTAPVSESAAAATDPAVVAQKKRAIERYEQLVQELESQGGVYAVQLSEILLGLGQTYQSLELHNDAINTFNRSLQISRVNSGLHNLGQLSILEQMITSNKALQDWAMVDKNYAYLYWVSKRNYGDHAPQLLPVIERLGKWHLHAYTEALDEQPFLHLLEADNLYGKAISIIELQHGSHAPQLLQALYGLALTNYQMATHVGNARNVDEVDYGLRSVMGNHRQRALQQELAFQDRVLRSYTKGKQAMMRIVAIHVRNDSLPLDSHALALTHLGDWYLLFNKRNSAAESYNQAYALMSASEEGKDDMDQFFAQPRRLPTIKLPLEDKEPLKISDETPYAVAMFNVSPNGRARNIEIVETRPADDSSLKRRARKSIAGSKFRPRFENGKAVATTGVRMRYIFDEK